jgi:hypothetical protein
MDEETKKGPEDNLMDEPVEVKDLILMTMLSLEGKAWAYLGLTSHPETKKPKKDLEQAKLAIDSIDVLYKMIEPKLSNEEKKQVQVSLTNLRLNFAK